MELKSAAPYIAVDEQGLTKGIGHTLDFLLSDNSPDAALNLYEIYFEPQDISAEDKAKYTVYSYRTNYISIPKRTSTTTDITYQNIKIPIITPGSDIDRRLTFTLRIDRDYSTIKAFENSLTHKSNGEFDYNSKILWNISVFAYRNALKGVGDDFTKVKNWKFTNCRIVEIAAYNYDYGKTDAPTTTVSFIWGEVDENIN